MAVAVGKIGMRIEEFYDLTYDEYLSILNAYNEKVQDKHRDDWERARRIAFHSMLPHVKKGAMKAVEDAFPLPWDEEVKAERTRKMKKIKYHKKYRSVITPEKLMQIDNQEIT